MRVPAFLLSRLYVKGSLARTPDGFRFQLRNGLGSGYAHTLFPLSLDDAELPMEQTTFEVDGKVSGFSHVTKETPFTLAMNKTTTIQFTGGPLKGGPHKLALRFAVAGLGEMGFDFTDIAVDGE